MPPFLEALRPHQWVKNLLVLFPLLMIGGSFFPFEAMPEGLAAIGRLTPNGMALTELVDLLDGEVEAGSLARVAGTLFAAGALLLLFVARRVRRGFVAAGEG